MKTDATDVWAELAYDALCAHLRPGRTPIDFTLLADDERHAWEVAAALTAERLEKNE